MYDAQMPIGMFSRASSLSVKALRAYHESGLLVPAFIDPVTNYRGYSVDQLADATTIVRLRSLDLPLAQVREVLTRRDPEHTRAVLEAHRQTMRARLDETERIVTELEAGHAPLAHTPIHVRTDRAMVAWCVAATIPVDVLWERLGETYRAIDQAIADAGMTRAGANSALYGPDIDVDEVESVEAFVPVLGATAGRPQLRELPEQRYAVVLHVGTLDTLADTYRTLGAWVARYEQPSGDPVRERYLVGPAEMNDPTQHRTEVAWPIAGQGLRRPNRR